MTAGLNERSTVPLVNNFTILVLVIPEKVVKFPATIILLSDINSMSFIEVVVYDAGPEPTENNGSNVPFGYKRAI